MNRMLLAATVGAIFMLAVNARAESCVDAFDAIANPQNFPGRVQSIVWSNTVLSKNSPLTLGNWTINFVNGSQYPIARITSVGYLGPLTGPVRKSYVYIDGLSCSNAVLGTDACTLVMTKTDVANTGEARDQDYFESGTPSKTDNGDLSSVGVKFIAWVGCPSNIEYVH